MSAQLKRVLIQYDVHLADAEDLMVLHGYEIVLICDDSGSMKKVDPGNEFSRWEELKKSVQCIVELGACFDKSGIDIHFFHSPAIKGVSSANDSRLMEAFDRRPKGTTPLTDTLQKVAEEVGGKKPVLLLIFTDGSPHRGFKTFKSAVGDLVRRRSTPHKFRIQLVACTDDDKQVGWLNDMDSSFAEVDCIDDYQSERDQILKTKRVNEFTKGDWIMKALLGPVSKKWNTSDEKHVVSKGDKKTRLRLLNRFLRAYDVHLTDAEDLMVLHEYEIVLICDDSGSMKKRDLPNPLSRWEELRWSVQCIVNLGACFDKSGIDIYFFHSPAIHGVFSGGDSRLMEAFDRRPKGTTPLTDTLQKVAEEVGGTKPVLLLIFTDGSPHRGFKTFKSAVGDLVKRRSTPHEFRIQLVACTDDDKQVGWLNDMNSSFAEVDCIDDYQSECDQMWKTKRVSEFSKGDWIMKALLGPVNKKWNTSDEKHVGPRGHEEKNALLGPVYKEWNTSDEKHVGPRRHEEKNALLGPVYKEWNTSDEKHVGPRGHEEHNVGLPKKKNVGPPSNDTPCGGCSGIASLIRKFF